MIPVYLQKFEQPEETFGKLSPVKNGERTIEWIVEGDPGTVEIIKRLFPGSRAQGRGRCRFPNTKRNSENLNWLMMRFPLEITDKGAWEESYCEAVEHRTRIIEFNQRPEKIIPPSDFKGELIEFQKEGLSYLINAGRALLADEMGLGKTIQALAYLAAKKAYPAIIVVPPHLIKNWEKEINKFLTLPGEGQVTMTGGNPNGVVHVIKGLRPYDLPPANIYIIHYLLLRGWKNALAEYNFKAVLFDEIQELRHTGTEKYSSASLLSANTTECIGLSGTPIYNRGGEIWAVMNIIEYHCLGDWESFTREWCYGYGSDIVTNPEQLGEYLRREGLMLRRTKDQVLKELPPKRRIVQTIDFDKGCYGKLIQDAVEKAKLIDNTSDYFEKGRLTRDIVDQSRRAIGVAKAPYVAAFIKMLLDGGERVLLSAFHHDVWDIYREELREYKPVFITGKETSAQKDESVEAFKNGKTNLCCISLRAAAGIDGLQSATCAANGELDWSPAIHSQFEDRIQRMGVDINRDSILCYYLVAEEGTDEVIQEFLGLKVSQFNGIMGDKAQTEEDKAIAQVVATEHMSKIVQKLKEKKK